MSAPLLYHIVSRLLAKGDEVDAFFTSPIPGSAIPIHGQVIKVEWKPAFDGMMFFIRDKVDSTINFLTLSPSQCDEKLHVVKNKSGLYSIENAPKKEPQEDLEEERSTEYDLEIPLLVHLAKKLMDKGERIDLHWDAPMEYARGEITSIEWDTKFRGIQIHFDDTTTGDIMPSDVFIKPNNVDDFELSKSKAGWVIARRD